MSGWFDNQKQSNGNLRKLLQERIEKTDPHRQLTSKEAKWEAIAAKLKCGENVQNRQLQTWLSEVKYAELDAERN